MSVLFRREDLLIGCLFGGFCLLTGIVNPEFFSIGTVFDLIRASIVPGILAMAVLLVLISGGIDVSFTAIAVLAMYASVKLVLFFGLGAHIVVVFAIAMLIGLALGLFNGFFIGTLRLPTLIVTLGTLSVYRGFLLTFVGASQIPNLPAAMRFFAHLNVFRIEASDGSLYQLPAASLVLVAIVVGTWFLLSQTTLGRSMFAIGGSSVSAERIGINVAALQYFVYGLVGALSGAAGVVHASLEDIASPFELVGLELSVIAAVVLGGARITGGHGSIAGTLLGVALVTVMNNTLIMWHVPSTWQNVVIGALILIGTSAPLIRSARRATAS